jgi:type IV pilus assembly protein PilO
MAKSLHELSPTAQAAVFALLCVLSVVAAWQAVISPLYADLDRLKARQIAVETEVQKAQAMAARLPAAQREVRALEAQLRQIEAVIPEEKDPQDVLRNLHELASLSLLDIASFKPKPIIAKAQYTEWPIELGLEGSYHDLGRFFDRIAEMSRLMSVTDLQIKTKARPNGRGTISASCVATTFVFQKDLADLMGDRP